MEKAQERKRQKYQELAEEHYRSNALANKGGTISFSRMPEARSLINLGLLQDPKHPMTPGDNSDDVCASEDVC